MVATTTAAGLVVAAAPAAVVLVVAISTGVESRNKCHCHNRTNGTTTPHSLLISTPTSYTTPDSSGVLTGAVIACAITAALLGLLVFGMCICLIYLRR